MLGYRLYFLDRTGRIQRAVVLECQDDNDAKTSMRDYQDRQGLELWQEARLVERFAPDPRRL